MDGSLDLYAESDENFAEDYPQEDMMGDGVDNSVDLYGDMGGESSPMHSASKGAMGGSETEHGLDEEVGFGGQGGSQSGSGRRYTVLVGNLSWWTSDEDLQELFDSYGLSDVTEIRIHENRSNGQSKGFAIVVVGSEETSRFLQAEISKKELQGQSPVCVPFSRQALNTFDAQARKNEGVGRGTSQGSNGQNGGGAMGPMANRADMMMAQRNPMPMNPAAAAAMMANRPRMPPRFAGMMGRFPMGMGMPGAMGLAGIRPFPGMRPPMDPRMMGMNWDPAAAAAAAFGFPPGLARMQMAGLPAPHVNPAFFGQLGGGGGGMGSGQETGGDASNSLVPGSDDFEGVVTQMKQIAGNALSRAAAECKTDAPEALNKLRAALAIITSSKVAEEERVQRSIKSLQEAMEDLGATKPAEARNGHSRSRERSRDGREREPERSRHRESDRERETRRRRTRSRSKSRERRRSSERDRERRERERERERHRESSRRDSDRERERERDRRR